MAVAVPDPSDDKQIGGTEERGLCRLGRALCLFYIGADRFLPGLQGSVLFELTVAAGNRDQCLLINTAIELKNSPPEIAGILQAAFADLVTRFREAIGRARAKNEIAKDVDPTHTAHSLLALYLGLSVPHPGRRPAGSVVTAGEARCQIMTKPLVCTLFDGDCHRTATMLALAPWPVLLSVLQLQFDPLLKPGAGVRVSTRTYHHLHEDDQAWFVSDSFA